MIDIMPDTHTCINQKERYDFFLWTVCVGCKRGREGRGGEGGGVTPEDAGCCAAWAAVEVAAGLVKRRLACVAVGAVGVAASGACNIACLHIML